MSRRGRLSDQQLAMTLEEDSGGEDDTTKEQWVEDGDDIDKEGGENQGVRTVELGDGEDYNSYEAPEVEKVVKVVTKKKTRMMRKKV